MRTLITRALEQYEDLRLRAASLGETLVALDAMIPRDVTIRVQPGENVQNAFDALSGTGGILVLASGAHPVALVHRPRPDPRLIIVRGEGEATLRGFDARPGSRNVSFETLGFVDPIGTRHLNFGVSRSRGSDGVWRHTMTTPEVTPSGFIFRHVFGRGPCKHGIVANCRDLLIEDSSFTEYYTDGADSQALAAYNGAANHVLRRSRFEAASENIIYGGADAASEAMFPQDILIEDCILSKREEWLALNANIKCLFELKNALRVTLRRTRLEHCWPQAWPDGLAIKICASNQENTNPTARSEDVLIEHCTIEDVGRYVNIIGRNDGAYLSGICRGITIRHNHFGAMHTRRLATSPNPGRCVNVGDGPEGVAIDHNTFAENRHTFLEISGAWPTAIVFTNNVANHGRYGLRNLNASPLVLTHNAIYRSPEFSEVRLPETNVYYEPEADLSGHVTSDGLPVGA